MNSFSESNGADAGENTATPPYSKSEHAVEARTLSSNYSDAEITVGTVLRTRYVLEEVVGRGGSSVVFRASDLHRALPLETSTLFVAVKLLQPEFRDDPQALLRLRREFRQTQRLSHPRIVRVFDLDCDGDIWFMTMELLAGQTAKTWMQSPHDINDALKVIYGCCEALEHAHSLRIVHGDLKPTNVVIGDDGQVTLIDFGSAANPDGVGLPPVPELATTALYASPQALAGKAADVSDDIFSLACLSYGLLSGGRHPFGRRPSLEDGRAKQAPTYVNAIPRELFETIERGLAVEPERRPASASEFRRELTEAAERIAAEAARAVSAEQAAHSDVLHRDLLHHDGLHHDGLHHAVLALQTTRVPHVIVARGVSRRAISIAKVVMLTVVTLSAVALFRIGTHRPLMRAAMTANAPAVAPAPSQFASDSGTRTEAQATPAIEAAAPISDSGVISFEAASIHASATQPLVAVSVRRLRGITMRGAFIWRIEGGSALPGTDFKSTRPELVKFNRGESVRTLFIPLVNARAASQPLHARTFSVVLEPVEGGPQLGLIRRATVTIDPPVYASTAVNASVNAGAAYQVGAVDARSANRQTNE